MRAILWDGNKQINGELILEEKRIKFRLVDFSETDLDFDLPYTEIQNINFYKLYKLKMSGLEISSKNNSQNVFVVENPCELKAAIQVRRQMTNCTT